MVATAWSSSGADGAGVTAHADDDGIIPLDGADDLLRERQAAAVFLSACEQRGDDQGYQRAIADVLASLVTVTETFLRDHQTRTPERDVNLRKLIYAFHASLDRHLREMGDHNQYVCDGLGI